ncbi:MAG: DUF3786 domain-containing protein [Chloroflexota bacterium]|nr:MAG: DUF3786 domain-containing protein [Chloroflexota bacterium]
MEEWSVSLSTAYEKAVQDMSSLVPSAVAARTGAQFDGRAFTLKLFYRTFRIAFPAIAISEIGAQEPPPLWAQILLLHHLQTADGTPVADHWIAFRELPGGRFFESSYMQQSIAPLVERFGQDLDGFREASRALGGTIMNRTGDAAFRFLAFPQMPIGCILYLADDEMPASVNIVFDESASHNLPTEDVAVLTNYFSNLLIAFAD